MSPASPSSRIFRNISTPVTTVFDVSLIPTISTSSPVFTFPCSIRPVTTVPRPVIENTSSIGIRNGLSSARSGCGIVASSASISSSMHAFAVSSAEFSSAFSADPLMIGMSSPGKS